MSSRRRSNGASPLINPQRQITSFFAKATSSPSPSPIPKSNSSPSPSPSPLESKPSPTKCYGEEVVGKRIKVLWPADRAWYKGCVKSFNKEKTSHLIQYDDGDEEELNLSLEKFELLQDTVTNLKRLRRGPLPTTPEAPVAVVEEEDKDESHEDNDSGDEDWGKSAEKEVVEEEEDETMELEDEEDSDEGVPKSKGKRGGGSGKRKLSGGGNLGSAKKTKSGGDVVTNGLKANLTEPTTKAESTKAVNGIKIGDASERFSMREAEKFCFLGEKRRDAKKRCPGDPNYDPRTLYLPPDFLKSLSGGQRQWWEFKSKHMDKVLFFKMGKFYELFEMDAHIGAKELDLQYMKGEQPHCGFPEKNFSMNVEKLARKGYRVLVIEQTETPEQMEVRRKEGGSKDKVVKREVCAVVTKGTLTEGEMLSANPDASYLMAVTETSQNLVNQNAERVFGVCVVDVATSRVILGQFPDDLECSALSCLLSELRPVELVKPAELLSPEAEKVLLRHTRNPLVNELVPLLEFWDAEKTVCEVKSTYSRADDSQMEEDGFSCLPDVLSELIGARENGICALSALGGALFYLKQAFLEETLLRFAKFELLPSSGFGGIISKPYMVLDAAAPENLEIFENSRNGDSSGTMYAQLNHCVTAFGKRLLKTWLARPLYHVESIKERQDAVSSLQGIN